ncbi:hypothetical protein Mapa_001267 [Marchantia paleacea]|nr:hypothetical protein Mapa_001267 [Marchantia paleacea]
MAILTNHDACLRGFMCSRNIKTIAAMRATRNAILKISEGNLSRELSCLKFPPLRVANDGLVNSMVVITALFVLRLPLLLLLPLVALLGLQVLDGSTTDDFTFTMVSFSSSSSSASSSSDSGAASPLWSVTSAAPTSFAAVISQQPSSRAGMICVVIFTTSSSSDVDAALPSSASSTPSVPVSASFASTLLEGVEVVSAFEEQSNSSNLSRIAGSICFKLSVDDSLSVSSSPSPSSSSCLSAVTSTVRFFSLAMAMCLASSWRDFDEGVSPSLMMPSASSRESSYAWHSPTPSSASS